MLSSILRRETPLLRHASARIVSPRTIRPATVPLRAGLLNVTPLKLFHSSARWDRRPTYTRFDGNRSPYLGSHLFTRHISDQNLIRIIGVVFGVSGIYYVYHLEKVPESGRWRFIDVSREAEKQAGLEAYKEIMREYQKRVLPPNHAFHRYVETVVQKLLTATGLGHVKGHAPLLVGNSFGDGWDVGSATTEPLPTTEWEVHVIQDDKTPNAFVLPGGKIFVFTGILPVCANEDGLATVLGHEIAHQVARHSGEKMSGAKVYFFLLILLEALGIHTGLSELGLNVLLALPNSRTQETEADAIGLKLMSQACYDPSEARRFWERMEKVEEEAGLGLLHRVLSWFTRGSFFNTHPASGKRAKAMDDMVPMGLSIRAASPSCSEILAPQYDQFQSAFREFS